jgi:hypothetical protein
MLVPMRCSDCGISFCVKHRFPVDHQCAKGKTPLQKKPAVQKKTWTASQEIARLQNKIVQGIITDLEQLRLATLLNDQDNRLSVY